MIGWLVSRIEDHNSLSCPTTSLQGKLLSSEKDRHVRRQWLYDMVNGAIDACSGFYWNAEKHFWMVQRSFLLKMLPGCSPPWREIRERCWGISVVTGFTEAAFAEYPGGLTGHLDDSRGLDIKFPNSLLVNDFPSLRFLFTKLQDFCPSACSHLL